MSKAASRLSDSGAVKEANTPSPEEVRRQLQLILSSPAFHGSKRCQQFLEYVCEKFLEGLPGALKERTIAVEVFGRHPDSDLAEDTIVRVGAREVRKRLAQFYVTPEGAASEVRIDLHPGAYAPEFRYVNPQPEEEVTPVPAPAPPAVPLVLEDPPAPRGRRWAVLISAVAFAALAAFAGIKLWPVTGNPKAFQLFWEPVFQSSEPMLIAVAHPLVYHASRRAMKLSAEGRPPQELQTQHPI